MFSFVHWPFCCRNHMMRWVQLLSCLGNCETSSKHFICPFIFTTGSFLTNLTRDRSYGAIRRSGEESAKKLRQDLRENTKHANSQPRHRFRFVLTSFKTCIGRPSKVCLIFSWDYFCLIKADSIKPNLSLSPLSTPTSKQRLSFSWSWWSSPPWWHWEWMRWTKPLDQCHYCWLQNSRPSCPTLPAALIIIIIAIALSSSSSE